jgi:LysR family glycine cleavage system transcriptional activator
VLHRLFGEELVPVASPKLIKREKIKRPEDLGQSTLLVQATRPEAWNNWFEHVGTAAVEPPSMLVFEQFAMVLQAAVAELGVALVPKILVRQEVASGELVELFDHPFIDSKAYYLAYPRERANYPPLVAFRDWLLSQVKS